MKFVRETAPIQTARQAGSESRTVASRPATTGPGALPLRGFRISDVALRTPTFARAASAEQPRYSADPYAEMRRSKVEPAVLQMEAPSNPSGQKRPIRGSAKMNAEARGVQLSRDAPVVQAMFNPLKYLLGWGNRNSNTQQAAAPAPHPYSLDPGTDMDSIKAKRDNTKDEAFKQILDEVVKVSESGKINMSYGAAVDLAHYIAPDDLDNPTSLVVDNAQLTDKAKRESIIVHELTHASADVKYPMNKSHRNPPGGGGIRAHNLVGFPASPSHDPADAQHQIDFLTNAVENIRTQMIADKDVLGARHFDYLANDTTGRLTRTASINQEFDSVINEMFYYMHGLGRDIRATKSYAMVRAAARAAHAARTQRQPVSETLPKLHRRLKNFKDLDD